MNLVVYVADALRTDHVGCYGARRVRTPTIDEFATGGVRYDQAISAAPWTAPSTTSILTGLYPHHHGYLHWDAVVDPAIPTLFTVAAAYGYETGAFVFDEDFLFKGFADANVAGTSETVDGAASWLKERGNRPFCLWFHSWGPHMPYDVQLAERGEWRAAKNEILHGIQSGDPAALRALHESYAQAVERESEETFASFLQALEDAGVRDDTAIVFLADHGESWGERYADKSQVQGTYHMHGSTLFDEILEVPLILVAPGLEPGVVDAQVRLVDVMPTLLELADAPIDGVDGESLLAVEGDRPAVAVRTDKGSLAQIAVRVPPWKLILDLATGAEEGYRLDLDPPELSPRSDAPQELRDRLHAELEGVPRETLSEEQQALVEKRLSDLGYL